MAHLPDQDTRPSALVVPNGGYWQQTRYPLVCLVFVLPLLLFYEGGILLLGPSALRNGADVWLRQLLDFVGMTGYFLLPVLTVALLLAWHHLSRQRWQVSSGVLFGMLIESAVLGLALLLFAHLQGMWFASLAQPWPSHVATVSFGSSGFDWLGQLVGFVGAGIYEEVLFRLALLPICGAILWGLGASRRWQTLGAIVLTSLAFSLAHYVGPHGEWFDTYTFVFRSTAGAFFALLFVSRGFGIAAGAHAAYDIFAGLF